MRLRKARPEDAPAMVALKTELPMQDGRSGGFLLGASVDQYTAFIERDIVFVLEDDENGIAGFSIVLQDTTLRQSEIWTKKDLVEMEGLPKNAFDAFKVAYFEQLAVRPGPSYRTYAKDLALLALAEGFKEHDLMFATVVVAPVRNTASLAFLRGAGFREVGEIDEVYPDHGPIRSAIHLLTRAELQEKLMGKLGEIAKKVLGKDADGLL